MEIYIEFAIIDNLVMNYILLFLTAKTVKLDTSRIKILLGALMGCVFAILLPLISLPTWLSFTAKIIMPVIMLFLITNFKNYKKFFASYLFLLAYTFIAGGACLALLFMINAKIFDIILLEYEYIFPVGLIVFTIAVYTKLCCVGIRYFYRKKVVSNYLYDVKLLVKDKLYCFVAFLDSGNLLSDNKSNLPVLIVSKNSLEGFDDNEKLKDKHYLKYSTLNGLNNEMLVFRPDRIEIFVHGEKQKLAIGDIMIGVVNKKFKDYSGLLPSTLFV